MVTNTTIYTRQRYVSLSTDTPDVDFRNGDEIYLIDTQQRIIYDEENNTWYPLPTGGGGGMPTNLTLLDSGTYTNANASANTLSIPTNAHNIGVGVMCLVYVENATSNTSQTLGATFGRRAACADFASADDHSWFPSNASFGSNLVLTQNSSNTVASMVTGAYYHGYSGATGVLTLARQSNGYPLLAGTYKWYVWGLPT